MPVSQPPITPDDPVRSSWDLEITQLVNRLEQQLQNLGGTQTIVQESISPTVTSVDQTGILRLTNGELSNSEVVTSVNGETGEVVITTTGQALSLNINNYVMDVTGQTRLYNFPLANFQEGDLDSSNAIPEDRHQVFLGGLKLVEGRDYTRTGTQVNLLSDPMQDNTMNREAIDGLVLELVIFRV